VKVKVNLTKKEYDYLINSLLKNDEKMLSKLEFSENDVNSTDVYLEEDTANDIRELAGDEVGLHFDENYEPTEEGWILEHFIDKFYVGYKLMKQKLIYMPLLNEGTIVSRPVVACDMGNNTYKIIGTKQGLKPEELDEEWLFPVGSYVTCNPLFYSK